MEGDWMHINSVAYNAELDQIMLSVHEFSEVWIIDHSTTTEEAATHVGGRGGKGGDLLYRWGNPIVYRSGTDVDQQLFAQHCAHWIDDGAPGAGNMLVFNNGSGRPGENYSSVDEVVLPRSASGSYEKRKYLPFGPPEAQWTYCAPNKSSFFSMLISGAQRLPNGNTFICSGTQGLLFEVTPEGEVVWLYKHPGAGFGNFGGPGKLVPEFLQGMLGVSDAQRTALEELQSEVDSQLLTLLSDEQRGKVRQPSGFPFPRSPGGPGPFPRPPRIGEVVPESRREELDLSDRQLKDLKELQQRVSSELQKIWTDEQQSQIDRMESFFANGPGFGPPPGFGAPLGGPPPGGPPVGGPVPGGPPPGFGPGGFGPRGPGGIFRCYRYGSDYAGLADKDLNPGKKLEDVAAADRPGRDDGSQQLTEYGGRVGRVEIARPLKVVLAASRPFRRMLGCASYRAFARRTSERAIVKGP